MNWFLVTVVVVLGLGGVLGSPVMRRRSGEEALSDEDLLRAEQALEMELLSLRPMPPAIILRTGGDKIFIPLPCKSKMCSALLWKLASMGKIPWHYAIPSDDLLLEEAL